MSADMRAPTPTGAAEMALPVKAELEAQIASLSARLQGAMSRQMQNRGQALRSLVRALPSLDQLLALPRRRFDEAAAGLNIIGNTAQKHGITYALSNGFGFGGVNACVLLKRWEK